MEKEKNILSSWKQNAGNWVETLENNSIESRKLATNQAIVDAVCELNPTTVWDLGCGEGWLSRRLSAKGMKLTGTDATPELVEVARQKAIGDYRVVSYEDIFEKRAKMQQSFDVIVINFALIGHLSTEQLLAALPRHLAENGTLLIQTLHPDSRKALNDYSSGWKNGSWDGLGDKYTDPYQWYFRTMEDWISMLKDSGFADPIVKEVFHPETGQPLSVIFKCKQAAPAETK